jgi:predicted DCC family thiol-disulfide oxidoreductase YuxK
MPASQDTLYFDGQCPLCAREISTLRRLQQGGLTFADIHQQPESPDSQHPDREQMLRRLHLHRADGSWEIGLPANVRAWSHTRLGWLFRPLLWPGLFQLAGWIYRRWADRRYVRKLAC